MIAGEQDMGLAGMGACTDRQQDVGMGPALGDQEQGGVHFREGHQAV